MKRLLIALGLTVVVLTIAALAANDAAYIAAMGLLAAWLMPN